MTYHADAIIDHCAVLVEDVSWHIHFFEDVFGFTVRDIAGDPDRPDQVWLNGGIQLIRVENAAGRELHSGHIGFMAENLSAVLEKAYKYDIEELPQGHNWFRLPEGICIEVIQARPGSVEKMCEVEVR